MARTRSSNQPTESSRPFLTPEGQQTYLVSLAYKLAEQRLKDGTASSQEVTHFLEYGSPTSTLKREKLERENELLRAKTEAIKSQKRVEELYDEAITAMRKYNGQMNPDDNY